jgi:predicted small metal-binding protein
MEGADRKDQHRSEIAMADSKRKSIDCRNYPSDKNCSLKLSGTESEVLDAAVQHAVSTHGHKNSPELREQIKSMLKDDSS